VKDSGQDLIGKRQAWWPARARLARAKSLFCPVLLVLAMAGLDSCGPQGVQCRGQRVQVGAGQAGERGVGQGGRVLRERR